jgi:thioredoxin 1
MANLIDVDQATFRHEVLDADGTVVVDFWAAWCRPCRELAPAIERLADERPDLRVVKLDVDAAVLVPLRYRVRSIPTVIRFDDGEPVATAVGARSYEDLVEALDLGPVKEP